ncbi:MAG: four helix bundle protein [Patescibacteria group bacterium]
MIQTNQIKQKPADLGDRTKEFALQVRKFVSTLRKTIGTMEDCRQLIRSSGSVGANYIEANESLSKKDFFFRMRVCRKEAKESAYWLELVGKNTKETNSINDARKLYDEAMEILKIFSAIIAKSGPS